MLRRIALENWHQIIPVISLALTGSAFLILVLRACFAKKETMQHASHLPLQPDDPHEKK
jgi:hypothetical protein